MVAASNIPATRSLTPKQVNFARLIVSGKSQADAWRAAYNHPKAKTRRAVESGSRAAAHPLVVAELARLRALVDRKTLLSLNDRLEILGRDAQLPGNSPAMVQARARVIKVYNETAGDYHVPAQEMIHTGDEAKPVAVTVVPVSKGDKIAALKARRMARQAAIAVVASAPPAPLSP